jgi:energy-coupling factor transporter transmembrane protein EcfT
LGRHHDEFVYRRNPSTWVYAFLGVVFGALFANGHPVGGGILIAVALLLALAWDRTVRDGDDHSGLY